MAPAPRARPPRAPLSSLKNPRPAPKRSRAPAQAKKSDGNKKCPNPHCGSDNVQEEEGRLVCKDCFTEVAESNIVAEVEFNDEGGDRVTVQGAAVHENSRHATTLNADSFRRIGGGTRNTAAETDRAGKRALSALVPKLGITENISVQAESIWSMAAANNFTAGRRSDEVAAACLYAACRRRKENTIILMDISELIKVNVFRLGEVYKDLCKTLFLAEEGGVGFQYMVELEPLIFKYCQKLQFGDKTNVVAEDALKIIRRMNRDWIVSGRHPAGLCGACIILAARMNNFQRSVREVVYVSKVADVTIAKRVEEFRKTKSASLTVSEFRLWANKIKHQHDPPSMTLSEDRERIMENRKRKREEWRQTMARDSQARESVVEIPDDATDASSRLSSLAPGTPAPEDEDQMNPPKRQRMENGEAQPTPPATQANTDTANNIPQDTRPEFSTSQPTPGEALTSHNTPPITSISNTPPQFVPVNTPPQTQESAKRKRDGNEQASGLDVQPTASKRGRTEEPEVLANQGSVPPIQAVRYDADGFAIPAKPQPQPQPQIDPALTGEATSSPEAESEKPAKRGRKRKTEKPPPIILSEEEKLDEDYLEKQIQAALENGEVDEKRTEVEKAKEEERIEAELKRAQALSEERQKMDVDKNKARREAQTDGDWFGPTPAGVEVTAEELEKEFENDPEVQRCVLPPAEIEVKERIWVAHNEDWLRSQAEKELRAKNAPAKKRTNKKGGKEKTKKKRSKMGDGTVLTESSTPILTPADAARAMLEKRAPNKSAHVDFSALQKIYGRETPSRGSSSAPEGSGSGSGPQSRDETPAASRQQSATPAPSEAESQAAGGAAVSPEAGSGGEEEVGGDEEQAGDGEEPAGDDGEQFGEGLDQVQPATWDNINDDYDEDMEEDEQERDDYRRAIKGRAEETDEFGVVPDYDSEGDEYE
ncbi:hypothetical protein PRZ48_013141 [Zasmidium cellare]|uniref:Uncharacterized protein n=1 Tax=Zasmidium cellare TaxID=395010 RepID=A0ABR0E372_ZASCE|nr:hypothetical protein PRZ48_013141 [Zasmidium cellare]